MSYLRFDETTLDWVIFAPSRARRPHELRRQYPEPAEPLNAAEHCPFCPGNEKWAPQEIYAERPPGGAVGDWQVRVVPNKFPALTIEADVRHQDDTEGFREMGGCGAHEVVIESRDHSRPLAEQGVEQVERVLRTVQERFAYTPYGQSTVLDGDFATDSDGISDFNWTSRFTCREYDIESGMNYSRYRYYHGLFGLFVNRDPVGYEAYPNLYVYVGGRPTLLSDPLGLDPRSFPGLACC